jgi:hypothetical protein
MILMNKFGPESMQRRRGRQNPGSNPDRGIASDRLQKANLQVCGHRLHSVMEQAVGHRRVEERRDNPPVKDPVVSLEPGIRLELRPGDVPLPRIEGQLERPWVLVPTEQTTGVTVLRTHRDRRIGFQRRFLSLPLRPAGNWRYGGSNSLPG